MLRSPRILQPLVALFLAACLPIRAGNLPNPIPPYKAGEKIPVREELLSQLSNLKIRVKNSPDNSQNLLEIAEVEGNLGDLDEAIKHARSAALYVPGDWRVHVLLAKLYILDRNALAAQLQAERALELTKEPNARTTALCLQVPALIELKKFTQADKLTSAACKKSPEDHRLLFLRSWVLAASNLEKDQIGALGAYELTISRFPSLYESHYNLALLLARRGDHKRAISELKTYLNGSPDRSTAKMAEDLISELSDQD